MDRIKNKGYFVTFEGPESAGKTTQIEALTSGLLALGYDVVTTREPGGTKLGNEVRNLLLTNKHIPISARAEAYLINAARVQHLEEVIIPALNENKLVICDRFHDSTLAYQGIGGGVSISELTSLHFLVMRECNPDLTIFIDVPLEVSKERLEGAALDNIESRDDEFHTSVLEAYRKIAEGAPVRVFTVDGTAEKKELQSIIFAHLIRKLEKDYDG